MSGGDHRFEHVGGPPDTSGGGNRRVEALRSPPDTFFSTNLPTAVPAPAPILPKSVSVAELARPKLVPPPVPQSHAQVADPDLVPPLLPGPPDLSDLYTGPVPDASRTIPRWLIVAGVVLLVLGLAFAAWYFSRPKWDPLVEPYVEFVEQARGYEFERPVEVRIENIADSIERDFAEAAAAEPAESIPDDYLSPWDEAYRMLGLYDPEVDLATSQQQTTQANAAVYYDPVDEVIVLPSGNVDLVLAETIVHELTHALQDQHGLLIGPYETADSWTMRRALLEGDATRIANMWFAQLSPADQDEYLRLVAERNFQSPSDDFLSASFGVPYSLGLPTVEMIVAMDGVEGLDALMRRPALGSTERLVDVLGESPTPTVLVSKEFNPPDEIDGVDGNLGPVTWFQVLAPHVGTSLALEAVIGFDTDAFRAFRPAEDGEVSCVRYMVWFDTVADAGEFASIADLMSIPALATDGAAEVTIDLCSPVGDPTAQTADVLEPLIWANYLAAYHLSEGLNEVEARCASLAHAKTFPTAYDGVYPDWETAVRGDTVGFARSCS